MPLLSSPAKGNVPERMVAAVLLLMLVNGTFFLIGQEVWLSRPIVNVDYLLPLMLAPLGFGAVVVALIAVWALDVMASLAAIYHFKNIFGFAQANDAMPNLALYLYANKLLPLFIVPLLLAIWLARRYMVGPTRCNGGKDQFGIIALAIAFLLPDVINGTSAASIQNLSWTHINISGSPLFSALRPRPRLNFDESKQLGASQTAFGDGAALTHWAESGKNGRVFLILVESLGLPKSEVLRNWLGSQLLPVDGEVTSQYEALPFIGSTVNAELRHLCNTQGTPMKAAFDKLHCLPSILNSNHVETNGYHGNPGSVFSRSIWWPKVGMDHLYFQDELLHEGARICKLAYNGVCDDWLIQRAMRAGQSPRMFSYVLTLSTHLPIIRSQLYEEGRAFCQSYALTDEACQLILMQAKNLKIVANQLSLIKDQPFYVVVVGDHAPPFVSAKSRVLFDSEKVPFWVIKYKWQN